MIFFRCVKVIRWDYLWWTDKIVTHQANICQWAVTLWETNVPPVTNNLWHESDARHVLPRIKGPQFSKHRFNIKSCLFSQYRLIRLQYFFLYTQHMQQQSWMQPFITLTQLLLFTGVFANWITSTFSQANKKDASPKLITIGQLLWCGLSKINFHFLGSHWQPMLGLMTASETLCGCATLLPHLNLACGKTGTSY